MALFSRKVQRTCCKLLDAWHHKLKGSHKQVELPQCLLVRVPASSLLQAHFWQKEVADKDKVSAWQAVYVPKPVAGKLYQQQPAVQLLYDYLLDLHTKTEVLF